MPIFSSHFFCCSSHFLGILMVCPHISAWGKCEEKMPIRILVVWAQLIWVSEMLFAETNVYLCKKIRVFTIRKLSNSAFNRRKNHISRTNMKIQIFALKLHHCCFLGHFSQKIKFYAVRAVRIFFPHILRVRKMWGKKSIMRVPLL